MPAKMTIHLGGSRRVTVPKSTLMRIWRRRQGWTIADTARILLTSTYAVIGWESGRIECPFELDIRALSPAETAYALRHIAGLEQKQVARDMSLCPYTVRKMEQGIISPEPLIAYLSACL